MIAEYVSAILVFFGSAIALIGSIGLLRFPDIFTRLHGPTKATTLGVGSVLLGTIIYLSFQGESGAIRELLITVFLFLTAPVSAHLIAKAALHRHCKSICDIPPDSSN
jgi:multicomponent K+:H+ antiporter subunit G